MRLQQNQTWQVKNKITMRQAEYFDMWANRDDMPEDSSRVWLDQWRSQQWSRSI